MKNSPINLLFILLIAFVACNRPECDNDNAIFENNPPDAKQYKDELASQLNQVDRSKLTYWFQRYDEQNDQESLYFNVQGDGLCAILHLTVNDWDKLESLRERKGAGRRGAEFTNLKFEISQDTSSTQFIYQTFDRIID